MQNIYETMTASKGGIFRKIFVHYYSTKRFPPPIIQILNGTFYRHHPNSSRGGLASNPPLFENLSFELASSASNTQHWCIIGPSSSGKTTFMQILRGRHIAIPPTARSYPYLDSEEIEKKDHSLRNVKRAIKYVGFDSEQRHGAQAPQSAYLSARYESRREDTDWSLMDYLLGNTELNPSDHLDGKNLDPIILDRVIKDLKLAELVDMPVSNLSNGQTRRARIAKALLGNPEVLLLDEPFMGLDPPTLLTLSPMLERLAKASAPRLVLSLRPQDPIPNWITHLFFLWDNCHVALKGLREVVLSDLKEYVNEIRRKESALNDHMPPHTLDEVGRILTPDGIQESSLSYGKTSEVSNLLDITSNAAKLRGLGTVQPEERFSRDGYAFNDGYPRAIAEPLVEMNGVVVAYGPKTVLGKWKQAVNGAPKDGLWWKIRRGERWGIFGSNGSGKTTLLSLICSDHPQTYSLPVKLFGRSRIPEPGQLGVSIFNIQSRIGHSSPEIHNHMPRSLSLRNILESAWSDTFRGVPKLDGLATEKVDACLRWFAQDLYAGSSVTTEIDGGLNKFIGMSKPSWADEVYFGELPFSAQRVALFLRAVIKNPDLVILDEAFSGMDEGVRDRCLLFLAHGETKQFDYNAEAVNYGSRLNIVESDISRAGKVRVFGLSEKQALLCISHVREEIPGSIREWICLPEANTGKPARFGKLHGPIEGDYRRWNEIWGM